MLETKKEVTNMESSFKLEFNDYKTGNTEQIIVLETTIKN